MYVCGGSFYEVCAYISGYAHASPDCPLSGDGWNAFNGFVCGKFRFPQKYGWPSVLKLLSSDDSDACARLQNVLSEFAERTKTEAPDEIARQTMSAAWSHQEGEPEQAWRRFSRAFHRGRRDEIAPLIQDHPEAEILWSTTFPDAVGPLLDQIEESCLMSQLSGSEDEGNVTVITPSWGPVNLKRIDGIWKVDATKIIESRKAYSTDRPAR